MFMFDAETLGTESTTVILSAAIVYFDENSTYQTLLDDSCFVKLNAKDQIKRLGRTVTKDTLDWWSKQHSYVKGISFDPSSDDLLAEDSIEIIRGYINKFPNPKRQVIWARGTLDQSSIDSLARKLNVECIMPFYMWRDVRTAVDVLYGSKNGYCEIVHPDFKKTDVIKHSPVHDCALDVMQLLYGKQI